MYHQELIPTTVKPFCYNGISSFCISSVIKELGKYLHHVLKGQIL